jgi:hypothetical protein
MFDANPSDASTEFTKDDIKDIRVVDMEMISDDGENFWGCPVCESDGYLSDITSHEELLLTQTQTK